MPRNKRKNKETKESSKPKYHPPRQEPKEPSSDQSKKIVTDEPSNKKQKKGKDKSSEQQYHPSQQISEEVKLPTDQTEEEDITQQLRRSKIIPRVSAKYLESIKAELQDSDNE